MGVADKIQMEGTKEDLLCTYSALILADCGEEVTADGINTLCSAANAVPSFYAQLYEKVNKLKPFSEMVESASKVGSGPAGAGPAAATTVAAAPGEAAKPESDDDDDDDAAAPG